MNFKKKSGLSVAAMLCLIAATLSLLTACNNQTTNDPAASGAASSVQSSAAADNGTTSPGTADVNVEDAPITGVETGADNALPEADVSEVDGLLQNWAAVQSTHADGATMNAELTVQECKIRTWGQELTDSNYESFAEANIYYVVAAEDGTTYNAFEYVYLEKKDGAWSIVRTDLSIGGYSGENGMAAGTLGEELYNERYVAPFAPDSTLFETPFQTAQQ